MYLLEYEILMKENNIRTKSIKELMEEDNQRKGRPNNVAKPRDENSYNEYSLLDKLPKGKIHLQSKELAMMRMNIQIDNDKAFNKTKNSLQSKDLELFKIKGTKTEDLHKSKVDGKALLGSRELDESSLKEMFKSKDNELMKSITPTQPMHKTYDAGNSYAIENDLNNHLVELERTKMNLSQPNYNNNNYLKFSTLNNNEHINLGNSMNKITELQGEIDNI
jgi:hypothetical protein